MRLLRDVVGGVRDALVLYLGWLKWLPRALYDFCGRVVLGHIVRSLKGRKINPRLAIFPRSPAPTLALEEVLKNMPKPTPVPPNGASVKIIGRLVAAPAPPLGFLTSWMGVPIETCDDASLAPEDYAYVYWDSDVETIREAALDAVKRYVQTRYLLGTVGAAPRMPPVLLMSTDELGLLSDHVWSRATAQGDWP